MTAFDETETVALSGPHLAELLAASGETPVAAAWELDIDVDAGVETTVVIPGSRRAAPEPLPRFSASSGSIPALAYSVKESAPPNHAPRRSFARDAAAFSFAALGLLIGVSVATALTAEPPAPSRVVAIQARQHVIVSEATPLAGAARQKVTVPASKRAGRIVTGTARSSAAPAAKAGSPRVNDAGEDPQLAEDQRLVLAAQLERSL